METRDRTRQRQTSSSTQRPKDRSLHQETEVTKQSNLFIRMRALAFKNRERNYTDTNKKQRDEE
jgi:hypothetical protein